MSENIVMKNHPEGKSRKQSMMGLNTAETDAELTTFTWADVEMHNTEEDCWVVLHGRVYDITPFLAEHPGGSHVLVDMAGKDATKDFEDTFHSPNARVMCYKYIKGKLSSVKLGNLFSGSEAGTSGVGGLLSLEGGLAPYVGLMFFIVVVFFYFIMVEDYQSYVHLYVQGIRARFKTEL